MTARSLNLNGKLMDLSYPRIMGILNATPDSFYTGSRIGDSLKAKAEKMAEGGVDIFDVGGYSTRPGAEEITGAEELQRVLPVIDFLTSAFPRIPVSIDTFRSAVARQSVEAGAVLVNDVSGGLLDTAMFDTVAALKVPYVLMHMRGTPRTMSSLNQYDDLLAEIIQELAERLAVLREKGVKDVLIDPGFGFAKTGDQNFALLKGLRAFDVLGCPLLVGISRKKMIYETLNCTAEEALNGTTVLNTAALMAGAGILRVHDVQEAVEVRKLLIDKSLVV